MSDQRMVFLYDGDCAFCSKCAEFITRRMKSPVEVTAWQFADIAELGLTVEECDGAVQWVKTGEPRRAGPEAIAQLLRHTPGALGFWKLAGGVLSIRLVNKLAWPVYRWVARNRDRMPGGTAACAMPQARRDTSSSS